MNMKIFSLAILLLLISLNIVFASTPCSPAQISVVDYNFASGFSIENVENLRFPIDEIRFNISSEYENSTIFVSIDGITFYQSPVSDLYQSLPPEYNFTPYYSLSSKYGFVLETGNLRDSNNSKMTFNLDDTQVGEITLQYTPGWCPSTNPNYDYSFIIIAIVILIVIGTASIYFLRKRK